MKNILYYIIAILIIIAISTRFFLIQSQIDELERINEYQRITNNQLIEKLDKLSDCMITIPVIINEDTIVVSLDMDCFKPYFLEYIDTLNNLE